MPELSFISVRPNAAKYRRVKSGCRTCKIRKIKCDEGRPACQRCIATGRKCDGYGIWGGGSGSWRSHSGTAGPVQPVAEKAIVRQEPSAFASFDSNDVKCFEWFVLQTATKLPGTFVSGFWRTLLLQASFSEPAVRHAVLALGSFHKRGVITDGGVGIRFRTPWERAKCGGGEYFCLNHYVQSLSELRLHLKPEDKASLRIVLICCIVFVYIESLRGQFEGALNHFKKGFRMLSESSKNHAKALSTRSMPDASDDWIVEAFSRLRMQYMLLKHAWQPLPSGLDRPAIQHRKTGFASLVEAWQALEHSLNSCCALADLSRQAIREGKMPSDMIALATKQSDIREQLKLWKRSRQGFATNTATTTENQFATLLDTHHTTISILTETLLRPDDEMAFDDHEADFERLVRQLAELWVRASTTPAPARALPGWRIDLANSVADSGWLAPLWFVTIKCRSHRLRRYALRLLESGSHREGMLDSKTLAAAARKVIDIEEGDFYRGVDGADDRSTQALGRAEDSTRGEELPVLPAERRLRGVELTTPGAPMERILLFSGRDSGSESAKSLLATFDVYLQRWTDHGDGLTADESTDISIDVQQ